MIASTKTLVEKKNFLVKTWKRCRSFPARGTKSMAPAGYFPVYVGPEKQRFAVKTEYANHPLFAMLLEDAETEYGYNKDGPISLPCDVDMFYKVLANMEDKEQHPIGWGFVYGSCSPFNPSRRSNGSYGPLTPSSLIIKMNN